MFYKCNPCCKCGSREDLIKTSEEVDDLETICMACILEEQKEEIEPALREEL